MYDVSNAYLTALAHPAKVRRITGTIGNRQVTEANFVSGSLKISNACSEGTEVKIGSVYMGSLEAVVIGVDYLNSWYGKVVTLSEGLLVGPDTWEDVPLGIYRVVEANHADDGVHITAYDDMRRADIHRWTYETFVGQPWDYLQEIAFHAHLELQQTENEIRALPNGTVGFSLYPENDIASCRDMLHWVAQTLGCIATINRYGKLELRPYGDHLNPIAVIGKGKRWRGGTVSDFATYYTSLTLDDIQSGTTAVYGEEVDNGLVYELGANPLLQYFDGPVNHPAWAILEALQNIAFTPFNIDMAACPAYDLCDVIEFSQVREGWSPIGCIMGFEYEFHGTYTLHGFGSNPALNNVKSPEQKALIGLQNQGKGNEIQYYTFENAKVLNISNTYVDIIRLRVGTVSSTLAVFQAEIQLNVTTSDRATISIRYVLNDTLIEYSPVEILTSGKHLLHLLYYFDSSGGESNVLKVKMHIDGGSASIAVQNIHAMVWGQGLVASDRWDGWIDLEDKITVLSNLATTPSQVVAFEDDVEVSTVGPIRISLTDNISKPTLNTAPVPINPSVALYVNKQRMSAMAWGDLLEYTWGDVEANFLW